MSNWLLSKVKNPSANHGGENTIPFHCSRSYAKTGIPRLQSFPTGLTRSLHEKSSSSHANERAVVYRINPLSMKALCQSTSVQPSTHTFAAKSVILLNAMFPTFLKGHGTDHGVDGGRKGGIKE